MALRATVFKVELSIADMDRGYYRDHVLTLARHPSETDERLMVRLRENFSGELIEYVIEPAEPGPGSPVRLPAARHRLAG